MKVIKNIKAKKKDPNGIRTLKQNDEKGLNDKYFNPSK